MSIERKQHANFAEVSKDIVGLEDTKEEKVTFATRAPTTSDKGRFWVVYTNGSSTMSLYMRHPTSGAWSKPS